MLSRNFVRVRLWFIELVTLLVIALFLGSVPVVLGQVDPATRPPTEELLPETTVLFVQIDDFRDMMEKMDQTAFGQFMQEEAVASLAQGIWEETKIAYEDVKEEVGIELDDIVALPSGEMTFALIAPRRKNPEFMLIFELNEESEAVDRVLDRGREIIQEEAGEEITIEESDDGIEFETFMVDGNRIKFFRKDGLIVGCTSEDELDAFIDRWMGREVEKVRPLSVNRKFVTIMNRCTGSKDLKPEARFYVDPIAFAKSATRGNFPAQAAINFLPVLGLDGLLGIGGSMILWEDDFESVVHGHILLANPRAGIFEMIALKPTNYQPEPWLPADTSTYMTTSWDIDKMLAESTKMIELYLGEEGMVDNWIEENINAEVGLDVKEDILANLTGRITYAEWLTTPIRLNSQVQIFALELSDSDAFETSFEKIIEKINSEDEDDEMEEGEYKGIRIWSLATERMDAQIEQRRQRREERGQNTDGLEFEASMLPKPAFAIVGDYLLMSFSPRSIDFIEHAIDTDQNDEKPMAQDLSFQTVSQKMTRLLKTDMPCAMTYQNPEHAFRFLFGLVNSEETNSFITRQSENNKYLAGFKKRFDDNPLPEFDKIKKYFPPTGGFMTTDDTGYHFLAFGLRESPEEEIEN